MFVVSLAFDCGKERLYQLFAAFCDFVRYNFVQPDEVSQLQSGYGFVPSTQRKDPHMAVKNLEARWSDTYSSSDDWSLSSRFSVFRICTSTFYYSALP